MRAEISRVVQMRFDPARYGSANELRSTRIRWLYDYWRGKSENGLPNRREIDPVEMVPVLSRLMLIEVVGARFRYRVVGTEVATSAGYDFTGRFLDEQNFANRDFYLGCYKDVLASRRPVFGLDHWAYPDGRNGIAEFGMLPLTLDGRTVGQILTIEHDLPGTEAGT